MADVLEPRCRSCEAVAPRDSGGQRSIQRKRERGALADRARDGERAAHRLGKVLADGQAESDPTVGGRVSISIDLDERIEDRFDLVRRYPAARIADDDRRGAVALGDRNDDATRRVRELDGVGEQVQQNLFDALALASNV